MFTGLVEKVGEITNVQKKSGGLFKLVIDCGKNFKVKIGDSVAINGCCLTVTKIKKHTLSFDVSHETLKLTTLGNLKTKNSVNLERALRIGDRLGGHLVSGHVDGIGKIRSIDHKKSGWNVWIEVPAEWKKFLAKKGSVVVDGVSLTINEVEATKSSCSVLLTLIPETIRKTIFSKMKIGDAFNFEVDLIAKHIASLL